MRILANIGEVEFHICSVFCIFVPHEPASNFYVMPAGMGKRCKQKKSTFRPAFSNKTRFILISQLPWCCTMPFFKGLLEMALAGEAKIIAHLAD